MVSCMLQGGLGNQLFQIAATYSLSEDLKTDCVFDFNQCSTPNQGNKSDKYVDNIFKNIKNLKLNFNNFQKFYQPNFCYSQIPKIDNQLLFGYFQSEKFFIHHKEKVKNLFLFDDSIQKKVNEYLFKIPNHNITAVHVRRGDYLNNSNYHPTCTLEYYSYSMKLINEKNMDFVFISDDIEWCKKNFQGNNIHYSPFTNEIEDLYLIMSCKNQIIANSSFSWWGAYLCKHDNKVICPKNWFGNSGPQDTWDLYLNKWIKI